MISKGYDPMTTAPAALRVTSWTFDDDEETTAFRRDHLDEVVDFLYEHLDQFGAPSAAVCCRRAAAVPPRAAPSPSRVRMASWWARS